MSALEHNNKWNEQNSIIEDLKPRGCTDMPKEIICNCTKEEFIYPEAYNEPFDEAIKQLKEQKGTEKICEEEKF